MRSAALCGALIAVGLVSTLVQEARAQAECCCEGYNIWRWAPRADCPEGYIGVNVAVDRYCCKDNEFLEYLAGPFSWQCLPVGADPSNYGIPLDGQRSTECQTTCESYCPASQGPIQCDGAEGLADGDIDQGCGEDEHGCEGRDQDDHPLRLSRGIVTLQPISLFDANPPGIEDGGFEYELRWGSHHGRHFASIPSGQSTPRITEPLQDTNYIGSHFMDNFADRIVTSGSQRVWVSSRGIITFTPVDSTTYTSFGKKFKLTDLGSSANPRYRVETVSTTEPVRRWEFKPFQYSTSPALEFWYLSSFRTGTYGWDIERTSETRITRVIDTLGREFRYSHVLHNGVYRVASVAYAPSATASATVVGTFNYRAGPHLDRVDRIGSYVRFLYNGPRLDLITDVVVPASPYGSPPTIGLNTRFAHEAVVEGHEFVALNGGQVRARRTYGASRHWYYQYAPTSTTQLDLNVPQISGGQPVQCSAGTCSTGFGCFPTADGGDEKCYVARTSSFSTVTNRITQEDDPTNGVTTYGYSASGAPTWSIGPSGTRTTHAYDSAGRLVCTVHNDDDNEAAANPAQPEQGCDPPSTGPHQTFFNSYSPSNVETTTFPSTLSPANNVQWQRTYDSNGNLLTQSETAYTRDVAGTLRQETRTTQHTYDSSGRVISTNGPLDAGGAHDVTEYEYWSAAGTNNHGRLKLVRRFSSSTASLVTNYSDYDEFGIAHTVTDPASTVTTLTASTNRLNWTVAVSGPSTTASTTQVYLNPNGTVGHVVDPDGICTTFDYQTSAGFLSSPTVIKRDTAQCGVHPIDTSTGEVEIRTFTAGKAAGTWTPTEEERLVSIERRQDDVTTYLANGFSYGPGRRLVTRTTIDSSTPWSLSYLNNLPHGVTGPGAPATGTWKSESGVDQFARPAFVYRHLTGTSKQAYGYSYASTTSVMPSQIRRGLDTATPSISNFVYDDWGGLVEAQIPESGTSRFEYDKAGRQIKTRVGVGTSLVRTSQTTFDMLGRATFVDNDLEHPVNCASAPTGTPISDIEFRYDTCVGGDTPSWLTCNNPAGRLTMARSIVQCSGGAAVKRGRWYSYDGLGRALTIWQTAQEGATYLLVDAVQQAWTSGSQLSSYAPVGAGSIGTKYQILGGTGRLKDVKEWIVGGSDTVLVMNQPLGPTMRLVTAVTIPQQYGQAVLAMSGAHRLDGSPESLKWEAAPTNPNSFDPVITYLDQTLTYGPAGLLTQRTDAASIVQSRHYQYDPLLRITCEARGQGSMEPSSADCVASSERLAALVTYNDGASSTAPPDTRATTFIKSVKNMGYTSAATEGYSYSGGSGKILQIARGSTNLVLGHDALGRRTYEYDSSEPSSSRRDYTYLPDGHLGSITGIGTKGAIPYSLTIRYDAAGRPELLARDDDGQLTTTELTYDDLGRLTVAAIGRPDGTSVTWYYHYAGTQVIAATRAIQDDYLLEPMLKRFWFVFDERGLIHAALDQQGIEYYRASWDASGIRSVHLQEPDMWVPFAFPGQLIAYDTEATDPAGPRPALVLNNARVYDPLLGSYLQPDANDPYTTSPEGYAYARSNPVGLVDVRGESSQWTHQRYRWAMRFVQPTFGNSCSNSQRAELASSMVLAMIKLLNCEGGICGLNGVAKDAWVFNVLRAGYECPSAPVIDRGGSFAELVGLAGSSHFFFDDLSGFYDNDSGGRVWSWSNGGHIFMPPGNFAGRWYSGGWSGDCLARNIAHEALHNTLWENSGWVRTSDIDEGHRHWVKLAIPGLFGDGPVMGNYDNEEGFINSNVNKCFDCEPGGSTNYVKTWEGL